MAAKIRLHQYLSKTGRFPSKEALWKAIRTREISVNGKVIQNPHYQIRQSEHVTWNAKPIELVKERVYFVVNKPTGYLSSRLAGNDLKLDKKSVFSLVHSTSKVHQSLFCVGRLDEDTSGLLILTNDGKLGYRIAHPSKELPKTYAAELRQPLTRSAKKALEQGVTILLEKNKASTAYTTKPCTVVQQGPTTIHMTITEGKKREVRRMLEAVGNDVVQLTRIAIGNLRLDALRLKEGAYRSFTYEELVELIGL